MFKKYQQIHFVGIGGIGMSGIAEVLLNLGYRVTGSDLKTSDTTRRLGLLGAKIFEGHNRQNVSGAHAVVVSSAVPRSNPEVAEARRKGIALVPRAEMLAELMRLKYGVAVAGTHGKTSTTSMIAQVLDRAGLDPTIIIGGRVNNIKTNAKLGDGEYLVAEADESDRSFLRLTPTVAVITNIDPEHMENYRDFNDMKSAFVEFADKVPFYGTVVACGAHPVVKRMLPRIHKPSITYGGINSDYTARSVRQSGEHLSFEALHHGTPLGGVSLKMTGSHNALNALAAIAVGCFLDIPFETIKESLECFEGISRRFEVLWRSGPVVVDDYAHHPVEVAATIAAARSGWPTRRIVVVLQPHRYSRLAMHFGNFIKSLSAADVILVADVYPAGEKVHRLYTGEKLWREVSKRYPRKKVVFAPTGESVLTRLKDLCQGSDIVLFLGAGNITQTARSFATGLKSPQ